MSATARSVTTFALALGLIPLSPGVAGAADDFSAAEQALFLDTISVSFSLLLLCTTVTARGERSRLRSTTR